MRRAFQQSIQPARSQRNGKTRLGFPWETRCSPRRCEKVEDNKDVATWRDRSAKVASIHKDSGVKNPFTMLKLTSGCILPASTDPWMQGLRQAANTCYYGDCLTLHSDSQRREGVRPWLHTGHAVGPLRSERPETARTRLAFHWELQEFLGEIM